MQCVGDVMARGYESVGRSTKPGLATSLREGEWQDQWQESESFLGASPFATITIAKRLKNLCNLKMAEVSVISYGNVQLIVISLLAINVSGWKLAEALTLCISANSVESCNSEVQSCLSDKKALKGYWRNF